MDCTAQLEAYALGFSIGFKTLFLIALVAFLAGYVFPRFMTWFDRRFFAKPMTAAQLQDLQRRHNAHLDKRIAKAQQRESAL